MPGDAFVQSLLIEESRHAASIVASATCGVVPTTLGTKLVRYSQCCAGTGAGFAEATVVLVDGKVAVVEMLDIGDDIGGELIVRACVVLQPARTRDPAVKAVRATMGRRFRQRLKITPSPMRTDAIIRMVPSRSMQCLDTRSQLHRK